MLDKWKSSSAEKPKGLKNGEATTIAQGLDFKIHQAIVVNMHNLRLDISKEVSSSLRGKAHGNEDEIELIRVVKEKIRAALHQALKENE
jgi:hypothetical protein